MPFPSILPQRAGRAELPWPRKDTRRELLAPEMVESKRRLCPIANWGILGPNLLCGLPAYAAAGDSRFSPLHFVLASGPESCHNWSTARGLSAAGGSARSIRIGCLGSFVQMRRRHVPNRFNASRTISRLCRAVGPVLLLSPVVLPWTERCARGKKEKLRERTGRREVV